MYVLREDVIRFPDGAEAIYTVVTNPDSAFIVPYFDNADTLLVRQWRHAWDESSWEVPAGTCDDEEDILGCARRELAEETGLVAERYTSLGIVRGAAFLTGRAHMFLAQDLAETERHPESYEQDMEGSGCRSARRSRLRWKATSGTPAPSRHWPVRLEPSS
jgi:ADP-ribose pyrophosphatase